MFSLDKRILSLFSLSADVPLHDHALILSLFLDSNADPSRSGILLTSSQYTHRPQVDDDIKRQHLSPIELLCAGTRGKNSIPRQPVGRVMPLVTGNTSTTRNIPSPERKRVSLPPEGSSSKKRIKLSVLQQDRDKDAKAEVKDKIKFNGTKVSLSSQLYQIIK